MEHIDAIGFDLFNTLIFAQDGALEEASARLMGSLRKNGFKFDVNAFGQAYREAALHFIKSARKLGRETHNSLWISAALQNLGYPVQADDPRISRTVDAYFSAFFDYCRLIPGTRRMLDTLSGPYRLGLLSNFTHAPAAEGLIEYLGLRPFVEAVIISGEVGVRKPNPTIFDQLADALGVEKSRMIYVGDDPDSDIAGAAEAGIQPVWMTYVRDNGIPVVPGLMPDPAELPGKDIPRISNWDDLFRYLQEPLMESASPGG
ncbi:MAG: HAD family hydrolase [Deltaproteobacteria bacterium]